MTGITEQTKVALIITTVENKHLVVDVLGEEYSEPGRVSANNLVAWGMPYPSQLAPEQVAALRDKDGVQLYDYHKDDWRSESGWVDPASDV